MPEAVRKRELGRGERVIPGIWRLRLPLPWPGVPHGNAWAIAAGDGVVLVDTGYHEPGSLAQLERAMGMVGLKLEHVRLLVCTHAHSDHYGQAAPIMERAGCELWMHPNYEHARSAMEDPEAALLRRLEVARQSGVPEEPLRRFAESRAKDNQPGYAAIVPPDRELLPGVTVRTDLGDWHVYETPGHAPSHISLYQPEHRMLISGDHLLGRISIFFDYGWTPDPAGEFLHSLDVVAGLDARLCLAGHGRTFTDVRGHIDANRTLVHERLRRVRAALRPDEPRTAFELIPEVFDGDVSATTAPWWIQETLAYLTHLEREGAAERHPGETERWTVTVSG